MDRIHYVVGDIHGQSHALESLLDMIEAYHGLSYKAHPASLVFLGDYIDKGIDSRGVIDIAMIGIDGFDAIYLKGNHEQLMLEALHDESFQKMNLWMSLGGETTLLSFGYDVFQDGFDLEKIKACIGVERMAWLSSLQIYYKYADFLCVHAGLVPEISLEEQKEKDALWIRGRFLDSDYDFGFGIIHGHTPTDKPIVRPNRIGVDTGAGYDYDGTLTALVVNAPWTELIKKPQFLSTPV